MRLTALDGARGLFCLIVALIHMPVAHSLASSPFLLQAYPLLTGFFMFSGFVMARAYGDMPATLGASADMLLKRVARLWPLHMAALAFLVVLEAARAVIVLHGAEVHRAPFTEGREIGAIIENIFLVQSWGFGQEMSWNYPSWTISTEFVAYLLLAVVCTAFASVRERCIAIALIGAIGAAAFAWESDWWRTHPRISMMRCLMDFAAGYLTFFIWRAGPVIRSLALGSALEIGRSAPSSRSYCWTASDGSCRRRRLCSESRPMRWRAGRA